MKEAYYVDLYTNIFECIMKDVLSKLREAFIEYYGEENIGRINNVFDKLTFIYITKNSETNILLDKKRKRKAEYLSLVEQYIEKSVTNLKEIEIIDYALSVRAKNTKKLFDFRQKFIKYSFLEYVCSKKKNEVNESIYLSSNKKMIDDELVTFSEKLINSGAYPDVLADYGYLTFIKIQNGQIPLHDLVHEINHHLQKESFYKLVYDDGVEKTYTRKGITNDSQDMIEELLNDYISKDVLNIYLKKFGDDSYVSKRCESGYFVIDEVCGYPVKKIYELLLDVIRKNLINGNAGIVKEIINDCDKDNYKTLDKLFKIIKNDMEYKYKNSNIKVFSGEYLDTINDLRLEKINELVNVLLGSITKSCDNYFKYQINCDKYIDELVKDGKARRI